MMNVMWVKPACGLAIAAGAMAYAVRGPRSSLLAESVYRGCRTRKSIAITFDDGPSESTPRVLELLARYDAHATFFLCGANVERLPGVARAIAGAGHELGNHTYSHPLLTFKPARFMRAEIERTQHAIEDATGMRPVLFRAPFGARWFGLGRVQREAGLMGVMWTVIGLDWKLPAGEVRKRLLAGAKPGAIVCLHDGRRLVENPDISATLDTIREILPRWAQEGYRFETVSQILCKTS